MPDWCTEWLTIGCESLGDTVVITVAGELDLAATGRLPAVVEWQQHPDLRAMVIDASQLHFIDASGLADVVELRNAAVTRHVELRVRHASPHIRRVFDITGLGDLLDG